MGIFYSGNLRAGLHYGGEVHRSWKKGVSQLWLVENATLDRWVFTLGEENNGGELFSWMIKWHGCPTWRHFLELGFSGLKRPEKPNSIKIFYCL
jgi:hypothetical protein